MFLKKAINVFGQILLSFCLIFSNSVYATTFYQHNPAEKQSPVTKQSSETTSTRPTDNPDDFSITSSQLGWNGPFAFGLSHDSLTKYSMNAKFTHKITHRSAFSALLEYGANTYRLGGTVGFGVLENGLFKVSAEHLSEVLPFDFDSGSINQRVQQNAFGARYQYIFQNNFWQDLSMGAYYASAPNKSLDSVEFSYDGLNAINYRNIAGGVSQGIDVGSEFKITLY